MARHCSRCGVDENVEMLAFSAGVLVCWDCDGQMEREWVEEDPENNRHYLDTFSPLGDR